jgi:uncharacterized membrane protein
MATAASVARPPAYKPIAPDRTERVLGMLTILLLAVVFTALARGASHWHQLPWTLWLHLLTMIATLALTPAILWMPRGTPRHRQFGYAWVAALGTTAIDSFALRLSNHGGFSLIHLLSVVTLVLLPLLVITARRHDHERHRRIVRGLVVGALLTAGLFTLPFGRMLGGWLFA